MRSGELSEGRIQLAAYLGDERARLTLGEGRQEKRGEDGLHDRDEGPLVRWVEGIRDLEEDLPEGLMREAFVRVAVAATNRVLEIFDNTSPGNQNPGLAIEAAESWLLASQEERPAARAAAAEIYVGVRLDARNEHENKVDVVADTLALHVLSTVAGQAGRDAAIGPPLLLLETDDHLDGIAYVAAYAAGNAAASRTYDVADKPLTIEELQKAIQKELIPWVLDEGDPVRERVEAREKEQEG